MFTQGTLLWVVVQDKLCSCICLEDAVLHDGYYRCNMEVCDFETVYQKRIILEEAEEMEERPLLKQEARVSYQWAYRTKYPLFHQVPANAKQATQSHAHKRVRTCVSMQPVLNVAKLMPPFKKGQFASKTVCEVGISCHCGCHQRFLKTDVESIKSDLLAVDMSAITEVVLTHDKGFKLVAKRDLPVGQLMLAHCNLKFEREDGVSSGMRYEIDVPMDPGIVSAVFKEGQGMDPGAWKPVLCPFKDQHLRYANLPTAPPRLLNASEREHLKFVEDNHNTAFVMIPDWYYMAAIVCRPIKTGDEITIHYGPSSHEVLYKSILESRTDG